MPKRPGRRPAVVRSLAAIGCAALWIGGGAVANAQVAPPSSVSLPADEAPHHNGVEWWYYTGHLTGVDTLGKQHAYGYEFTIFQVNLVDGVPATYSAHYAITDLTRGSFNHEERVVVMPIPAETNGYSLPITNWLMGGSQGSYVNSASFTDGSYSLSLKHQAPNPATLLYINGIANAGAANAIAYYSFPNMATTGTIIDHGLRVTVTGTTEQDHQWVNLGSNPLANPIGAGWNWFGVMLNNNVQYNLSFIQDSTGAITQVWATEIKNGVGTLLPSSQVSLASSGSWTSPISGLSYPTQWQVKLPDGTFVITPYVQGQEMNWPLHKSYYEGDSSVVGTWNGQPITGKAYAEVSPIASQPVGVLP